MKKRYRKGHLKRSGKRWLALLMSVCLIGTMIPITARAENGSTETGLCEHHTEHTTECGYAAPAQGHECGHVHDESCGYQEASECTHVHTEECGENGENCTHVHTSECGYAEGHACEHVHDEECGYAEASEGSPCTFVCDICGKEAEPGENNLPDETLTQTQGKLITAWQWIDEEGILDEETGNLALPGASEQTPAHFEEVTAFLPTQIQATVEDADDSENPETGVEETITLGEWACDNYPEEGAYSGSYTFTAALPEGYALSEEAEALTVLVELGGAQMWYDSGSLGNGLSWTLNDDGTLTICGEGDIPDANQWWDGQATSVKEIVIEEGVTGIGDMGLCQCTNLTSVTIPSTVTSIGKNAFLQCTSLTTVSFADECVSTLSIGDGAFNGCTALESIEIPNYVTTLGVCAFEGCSSLQSVTFEAGSQLNAISDYAFYGCNALESIMIPESVTTLGTGIFDYCNNLNRVTCVSGSSAESYLSSKYPDISIVRLYKIKLDLGATEGYTITQADKTALPESGQLLTDADGSLSFRIEAAYGYNKNFTVKADGTEVTAVDGVYTISGITENKTIALTIEGAGACSHNYNNGFCTKCDAYEPAVYNESQYYYEINNAGQLYWFAGLVNGDENICTGSVTKNTSANAVLTADITVNSGLTEDKGLLQSLSYDSDGNVINGDSFRSWTPIGNDSNSYTGTFDGQGFTVSGLYFNNTGSSTGKQVGLFGCVGSGGKVSKVGVVDSYFNAYWFVGGVCGYNIGGNITECYNKGTVNGNYKFIGGVCGNNYSGGIIQNCYNEGSVTGKNERTGGVCGGNENATIINCYNTGKVAGRTGCGGVCGNNYTGGTIQNCYNIGTVSFSTTDTTGAIGGVCGYNKSTITNCYFDSDKYTGTAVGGTGDGSNVSDNVLGKTTEQFASGEVAYLLNGSLSESPVWYQNIDRDGETADAYPVLDSGHGIVYLCTGCPGVYSNTENKSAAHRFEMVDDTNHKCKNCGLVTVHSTEPLTYTADGAKDEITVKCGDDCGKEYGTVTLSAPTEDLTYDGNAKTASVTNNVTGVAISNPTITYKKGGVELSSAPTDAGTYTASITLGTDEGAAMVSVEFTIEKATPTLGDVSVTSLSDTLDTNQVVFSRTNSTVAGTFALTDGTKLQYGTYDYAYVFTPTGDDAVNYKPVEGTVSITVNDTIAPTAEYQIGENGWKKFVNTISFGLFCKDYKTVEITYSDVAAEDGDGTSSGVKTGQYYIANKELTNDDIEALQWNDYTNAISLNGEGVYFIYVRVEDNAGNSVVLNSEGIVIYAESTLSPTSMDYTYKENKDLDVQITMNGNTFGKLTDGAGTEIAAENYTIDESDKLTLKKDYLDTLNVGEYTYKVYMNPQGQTTDTVTLEYGFVVNVKAVELTVTEATATSRVYDTTKVVTITAVTLSGIKGTDTVSVNTTNLTGTLSSANVGAYTSVTLPALTLTGADAGNYTLVQPTGAVQTNVTISKADATVTVGTVSYDKTFGDADFTLGVTDTNTEANVQYAVTAGNGVVSVSNGTVTILKAGTATITVSLPASTNYNAAEDKTITVTVAKKSGHTVDDINKSYLYSRDNADTIDLSGYLPSNCGTVTYGTPLKNGDLYTDDGQPAVSSDGKLSYTVKQAETYGAAGTIEVTVSTENYADFTITVNVKLIDQIPVSLKEGSSVTLRNSTLSYGQALSTLAFNSAVFVDGGGNVVTGTLAWKTPDATPNAGTTSATWVFTPNDASYATVEDTVAITVNKATPQVTNLPTVAARTYNPTVSLTNSDLTGGTVNVSGSWSWQTANIIPTVNNNGYVAVFTPSDSTNYETVTGTITVTVTKATPYIKTEPTAAAITYGDTLGASTLSDGTVQYSSSDATTVAGSFTWEDSSVKPSVSDSNSTTYRIVFTPSDAGNYNTVETDIRLTVNKAGNAPNMPSSTMNVANSCEKVSDVTLPTGWVWQDADKDTALTVGTAVTATAEYNGADKGNYENETVSVSITRSACDHAHTEVRNAKEATCKETGYTGDTYCTDCGALLTSGTTIPLADHQGGTATCTKKAVCTVCGQEYGTLNANNHVHTEIRGAVAATCTAGGYTGDTYCTDCGVKTKTGTASPALGHNYTSKVTTEPTTDREGVRTYTCDRCGHSYTESIPKLDNGGSSGGGNNGGGSSGGSSSGGNNGGGSSAGGSSSGGNNGGGSSSGGSSSGGTEAGTGDQPENSGNTTTITNEDGSTTTTKTETDTNGNTVTTSTTVATDGSSTEKVQATETNTAGKEVAVTTTTKTDADGNVTSVTEKSVIEEAAKNTAVTVTTKADGSGKINSATAKITKTSSSSKVSLSGAVLEQITDVAGADTNTNVRISMTVKDTEGRTRYTIKADSDEITAGKKLYIYQLNTKTGKYTMVDNKEYEVTKAGTVTVNMTKKATYELVTAEESRAITKEILATVKPAKSSKSLPVKNTTTFKLSDMLDMDNIKRITYATSKKSVATVTKKGTIKAVKAGTATVKATVTLKNGTKKTIKMTIKVK